MEYRQTVIINGGQSQVVSFPITASEKRVHNVFSDGLTGTFEVVARPASFQLSNLVISPQTLYEGETVNISLTVTNTGELAGTKEVVLSVD